MTKTIISSRYGFLECLREIAVEHEAGDVEDSPGRGQVLT